MCPPIKPPAAELDDQQLLEKFCPRLQYDSQAVFRVLAVDSVTDNPGNQLRRGRRVLATVDGVPALSLAVLADEDASGRDRLRQAPDRVADALRLQADPRYANVAYGRVIRRRSRIFLQYWLWFYGQDNAIAVGSAYDTGGWRVVQIELAASREPLAVAVSNDRNERRAWTDVERIDDRVVVYIASRAQFLYLRGGWNWSDVFYDGCDGHGPTVVPRLGEFTGWERWPGKWSSYNTLQWPLARSSAWRRPARFGRLDVRRLTYPVSWAVGAPVGLALRAARAAGIRWARPAEAPTLTARLEKTQIVVGYKLATPRARWVLLTAHIGDRILAARRVRRLEESGEETLAIPAGVSACELRVSAFRLLRMRTQCKPIALVRNAPDPFEASILDGVVEGQLASREVQQFAHVLEVNEQDIRQRLDDDRSRLWSSVATELQAFRDARSAQTRLHNAEARRRRAVRLLLAVGIALVCALGVTAALFLDDSDPDVFAMAAIASVLLLLGLVALGPFAWRSWRHVRAAARTAGSESGDTTLVTARAHFQRALREKGVAPVIREVINTKTMDRYIHPLSFGDEGLPELRALDHEVPTAASERIWQLTRRMRGGSIGIAGPRGAGKTTLMHSYCQARTADDRRLTTIIAAPVRYEPRDFILTLFARLCEGVLGAERADAAVSTPTAARIMDRASPVLPLFAGVACLVWLVAAWKTTVPAQLALGLLAFASLVAAVGLLLGIPLRGYRWGAVAAGAAAVLLGWLALKGDVGLPDLYLGWLALVPAAVAIALVLAARPPVRAGPSPELEDQLIARAREQLRAIRFQQSYSTGYAGKLSLVGGAEASIQTREDLAERQQSVPEIVERLRAFIALAARARGGVAIGIDELDKIESAEVAEQFLNEIKGVFGVEGCFYLVSISENALASFERRGLPLRDVFDSSFDEVLFVGPLSLRQSKFLLRGRVLGLGPGYLDLCHCMSGGLARDVLRVARQLSLHNRDYGDDPLSLQAVAERVARAELQRKGDAMTVAAQRIPCEPYVSELLFWIRQVRDCATTPMALLDACASNPRNWPREPREDQSEAKAAEVQGLERLRVELATFTYYLATVLELFSLADDVGLEQRIRDAEAGEEADCSPLDHLARARGAFAVNPLLAVEMVNAFRRDLEGWRVLSFAAGEETLPEPG